MKISICTGHNEYLKSLSKISIPNFESYCGYHGYDLLIYNDIDKLKPNKCINESFAWYKLIWLKKHLSNYDYILWVDIDALFINKKMPIESFISSSEIKLYLAGPFDKWNTGVFLIKNDEEINKMLEESWSDDDSTYYEQESLVRHSMKISEKYKSVVNLQSFMNSEQQDVFILHFPYTTYPILNNLNQIEMKEYWMKKFIKK
jgi:hypothetical protein